MTGLRDNRFAWFDLYVHDPVEASAFYTEVVGWGSQPFGERSNGYRMFMAGEKGVGGITKLSDDMKSRGEDPHWRAFVQVADVDATIKKARSLGAEVLSAPFDVPGVGRLSAFLDPQGASLGVYAPKFPAIELEASPVPTGHFVWHELAADDGQAALAFYGQLFGWRQTDTMPMGEQGIYRMFGSDGMEQPLGGMMTRAPDERAHWLYYVRVADIDASVARVLNRGGQLTRGPMSVPGDRRIAQCLDPQGVAFALEGA